MSNSSRRAGRTPVLRSMVVVGLAVVVFVGGGALVGYDDSSWNVMGIIALAILTGLSLVGIVGICRGAMASNSKATLFGTTIGVSTVTAGSWIIVILKLMGIVSDGTWGMIGFTLIALALGITASWRRSQRVQ